MVIRILVLFLWLVNANAANANQNSDSLVRAGRKAISYGEGRYALYKFREAWLDLSPNERASRKGRIIMQGIAKAFVLEGQPVDGQPYLGDSTEFADEAIRWRKQLGETNWSMWTMKLDGNVISFFAPDAGVFGLAYKGNRTKLDTAQLNKCKELEAQLNELSLQKFREMPIKITPQCPHYDELLALTQLRPGEIKSVNFDLNPFIPEKYGFSEF